MASNQRKDNAFHKNPKTPKKDSPSSETRYSTKIPKDSRSRSPKGAAAGSQVRPRGGQGSC